MRVVRVNGDFQGCVVSAGRHRITFSFSASQFLLWTTALPDWRLHRPLLVFCSHQDYRSRQLNAVRRTTMPNDFRRDCGVMGPRNTTADVHISKYGEESSHFLVEPAAGLFCVRAIFRFTGTSRLKPSHSASWTAGSIKISDGARIGDGVHPYRACKGSIVLHENVFLGPYTVIYGNGGVTIGKNTMIAGHSFVVANNHVFEDDCNACMSATPYSKRHCHRRRCMDRLRSSRSRWRHHWERMCGRRRSGRQQFTAGLLCRGGRTC